MSEIARNRRSSKTKLIGDRTKAVSICESNRLGLVPTHSVQIGYKNGYDNLVPLWRISLQVIGANGEGRTPIPLREPDPKSGASANSATFAQEIAFARLYRG
jgi:hypothetical protein